MLAADGGARGGNGYSREGFRDSLEAKWCNAGVPGVFPALQSRSHASTKKKKQYNSVDFCRPGATTLPAYVNQGHVLRGQKVECHSGLVTSW